MKNKGKGIWLIVGLSIVFALSPPAFADQFLDGTPLLGDVTSSIPSIEIIIPYFRYNAFPPKSLTIWYNIYENNSTTKLYGSTPKTVAYPAFTCGTPSTGVMNESEKFILSGKWMIAGVNLRMECSSASAFNRT